MPMSYIKVFFDFEDRTEELNDNEKGALLLAMLRYARTCEKPDLSGNERFLFSTFKTEIDRDKANYDKKVANGSKGGRPPAGGNQKKPEETGDNQTKPNETENNQTKPEETEDNLPLKNKNKEQEQEKEKKESKRFAPPSEEEVRDYCREKGYEIDAEVFVAFYASKGWKVGNQPMKSWKQALVTWAKRRKEEHKDVPQIVPRKFPAYSDDEPINLLF